MNPLPATPSRFVRVTSRDADWVQFEFSIGDPDLCVELTMRPAQYDAFRRAQRAIVLAHLPADQLDRERRHWHDSVPGAHPHD
ncbi:phenol hydroxylase [Massilia sp. NEAU-DD11]|uniref:Phenol hydroxylase n=1 Tax=Massilia cellulosiltytica TaxID=2683234 RepID=A0A7X3K6L0_9BURK|nr:phenol hydroxylase subunit [Telluria cellulosilytica]MVW59552.1 phenol hydroxylase [Telluria cellulosilytica]